MQLSQQKQDKIISSENKAFTEKCIRKYQNFTVKYNTVTSWLRFWCAIDYLVSHQRFAYSVDENNEYNLIWVKMVDGTYQIFCTIIPNYDMLNQFFTIKLFNKLKLISDDEYEKLTSELKDRL